MRRSPFGAVPPAAEGAFDRLRESINPDWIEAALEATAGLGAPWTRSENRNALAQTTAPARTMSAIPRTEKP